MRTTLVSVVSLVDSDNNVLLTCAKCCDIFRIEVSTTCRRKCTDDNVPRLNTFYYKVQRTVNNNNSNFLSCRHRGFFYESAARG